MTRFLTTSGLATLLAVTSAAWSPSTRGDDAPQAGKAALTLDG